MVLLRKKCVCFCIREQADIYTFIFSVLSWEFLNFVGQIDARNSPLGIFIFISTAAATTTVAAATTITTITIITLGEKWQGVKLSLLDRGVTSSSNPTEWMSFYDVCVSVIIHRTYIPKPQRGFCTLWSAIHRSRSLLTLLLQLAQTIKWLANYGKFGELPRSAFEY